MQGRVIGLVRHLGITRLRGYGVWLKENLYRGLLASAEMVVYDIIGLETRMPSVEELAGVATVPPGTGTSSPLATGSSETPQALPLLEAGGGSRSPSRN